MNNIVDCIPGQIMEFCLMHNPSISLIRLDTSKVSINKKDDKYILNMGNELIDITDIFDHDALDSIIIGHIIPLYYRYILYDTEYILIAEVNNTNPISATQSFIDIVRQAYSIYAAYHKIETIDDAMEYFCRAIMIYNQSADEENGIIPIPLDDDETKLSANCAWTRFTSLVQYPLLMYTDL